MKLGCWVDTILEFRLAVMMGSERDLHLGAWTLRVLRVRPGAIHWAICQARRVLNVGRGGLEPNTFHAIYTAPSYAPTGLVENSSSYG